MSLTLDANEAKKADNVSNIIRETGKYTGVITRAEKLLSKNNVQGFGLSFKADDGSTANYLDLYTIKPDGSKLFGLGFVQAILACTKTKQADEGKIEVEKWDKEAKQTYKEQVNGYPSLIGKRIGLLLQKELTTNIKTGADAERLNVYGVFEADTGFTSSEILDRKTQPEQLDKIYKQLMSLPLRDSRNKTQTANTQSSSNHDPMDDLDSDLPF